MNLTSRALSRKFFNYRRRRKVPLAYVFPQTETALIVEGTSFVNTPFSTRLMEIIDDQVFAFAQGAQRHFGTNDLMVLLDFREAAPELEALPRQRLADAEELPLDLRLKLFKPASDLKELLGSPEQSFWFLVILENGDFEYGAINASLLAPCGTA